VSHCTKLARHQLKELEKLNNQKEIDNVKKAVLKLKKNNKWSRQSETIRIID